MSVNTRARIVEGGVIVGSILLAFAIDAGWSARGEARDQAVIMGALYSEMQSTVDRIDGHLERRRQFAEALATFLGSSPTALADLSSDSAGSLLRRLTFLAPFTASIDPVRSADVARLDDVALRTLLGDWMGAAENVAEDQTFLVAASIELARLSGLVGGPRALSRFDFPEVPQPNVGLSRLRSEGQFVDAILVFDRREQNNLRKIRALREHTVSVLFQLESKR
jgi:hypothetical protein